MHAIIFIYLSYESINWSNCHWIATRIHTIYDTIRLSDIRCTSMKQVDTLTITMINIDFIIQNSPMINVFAKNKSQFNWYIRHVWYISSWCYSLANFLFFTMEKPLIIKNAYCLTLSVLNLWVSDMTKSWWFIMLSTVIIGNLLKSYNNLRNTWTIIIVMRSKTT